MLRARCPDLLSGDHQAVAVDDTSGAQGCEVGTGPRFGKALTPHVPTIEHRRQKLLLLFGCAVRDEGWAAQVETDSAGQRGNPAFGRGEVEDQLLSGRGRTATEFRWPGDGRPSACRHLGLPFARRRLLIGLRSGSGKFLVHCRQVSVQPCRPFVGERRVLFGQVDLQFPESGRGRHLGVLLHDE